MRALVKAREYFTGTETDPGLANSLARLIQGAEPDQLDPGYLQVLRRGT